jgi:branched-chain amino acid transport system ATP-binding protein
MENLLLHLQSVTSGYGKIMVIREVTLKVGRGQIVTLLGSNGVGKSTTLRTITGTLRPQTGKISYNGRDISRLPPHRIAGLGVGYSPEGRRVFGNLTVQENLWVGAYKLKSSKKFRENLEWVHSLFPRLKERSGQIAESLSGGEQQMLAIGRALISGPGLLLLDEPSLGLAPLLVEVIASALVEINKRSVSILLIEQNAKLALNISHFAFVMDKGSIVIEGESGQLTKDQRIMDVYLGFA